MSIDGTESTRPAWRLSSQRELSLDRARILAILNVTPDSFSDGGEFFDPGKAVAHALECAALGADVIDVGGESTRPGATRIDVGEQIRRVVPVIHGIRVQSTIAISVDTTRSEVARAAIDAGAMIINDVSAGTEDDRIFDLAAQNQAGLILMHRTARPEVDRYSHEHATPPRYANLVQDIRRFLFDRVELGLSRGLTRHQMVVDPGLGFGKDVAQNLELIANLDVFDDLGVGVLSAASRKSFVGKTTGVADPDRRLAGTLAVSIRHALAGVRLFRVHDVAAHVEAFAMLAALRQAGAKAGVDGLCR